MNNLYITPSEYETAIKNGISEGVAYSRVYILGWDVQRAITEPVKRKSKWGWDEWKETATKRGVSYATFIQRLKRGMTHEESATMPVMSVEEVLERRMEGFQGYLSRQKGRKNA